MRHLNGSVATYMRKLHEEYGPAVCYTPNEVSFTSGETAWADIYGFRTGAQKGKKTHQKDRVWFAPAPNGAPAIIIADDQSHSRGRRILSHAFSAKALSEQEALISSFGDQLVDGLKENCSSAVELTTWYNWTTFDVIAQLCFGEPFGCLQSKATHKYVQLLLDSIRAFRLYYVLHHFPLAKYLGSLIVSQGQLNSRKAFLQWVTEKTRDRCEKETQQPDFMTEILKHNGPDGKAGGLSQEEMVSNMVLFLGAGTETTATTLSAATYLLCKHPSVLSKLQAEVRGRWKEYGDITLEEVNSAPYLLAVLWETLRFFPPVPTGFPRILSEGGEVISGHYVPEGASVCMSSHASSHSTRNFTDPESFVPERWMGDERYANDHREGAQPFSFGPRNCLGKVSHLVIKFDLA